MRTLTRLGVIGLGEMGLLHCKAAALLNDVVLAAISDTSGSPDIEARVFADPHELLTSGSVDAVTIATPPAAHSELVTIALSNGLNVLCEKPLALTTDESERLAELAVDSGQVAVVSHQLRFETSRREVRDLLQSGDLGEPSFATFVGIHPRMQEVSWSWWSQRSAGGGMLREFGSHLIDLALWMFGPARIINGSAQSVIDSRLDSRGILQPSDSDDVATLSITHESGVVSTVHVAGIGDSELRAVHVRCRDGSVSIDGTDLIRVYRHAGQSDCRPWFDSYPALTGEPSDHWTPPFMRMMDRWLEACRGGALDPDLCTFRQASDVIQIIQQVSPVS